MWDPEKEKEKNARHAKERSQLPPLAGKNSKEPEIVPLSALTHEEKLFFHYLENNSGILNRYFMRKVKEDDREIYELMDVEGASNLLEPAKSYLRTFCELRKREGRFRVAK